MAKLGEVVRGAALDSIGLNGVKSGWDNMAENKSPLAKSAAVLTGVALGVESFLAPNAVRDYIVDDNVSTTSEYYKGNSFYGSIIIDALGWAGVVGVGLLTKQLEAALAAKVAINAGTSAIVRTYDSIQRKKLSRPSVAFEAKTGGMEN